MTETAHTPLPDAYLFTNEWGEKELMLSCHGERAQRLLELGWTYSELFTRADSHHRLVEALRGLAGNAGALRAFEWDIREACGNTNWQCLMDAIAKADAALKDACHDR